jgi:microcystin-dependent protein
MGGDAAGRVTSDGATNIGNNLGSETTTISTENLPEHEHDLRGDSGDQYYVIRDIQGAPQDTDAIQYDAPTGTQAGQALPSSGGVKTTTELGRPINVMNPYLAVNYIIYHGVV